MSGKKEQTQWQWKTLFGNEKQLQRHYLKQSVCLYVQKTCEMIWWTMWKFIFNIFFYCDRTVDLTNWNLAYCTLLVFALKHVQVHVT